MLIELDLAGADWSVVANLSGDQNMMGVLKSGKSPHIVTAQLMTGLPESVIEKEDELLKSSKTLTTSPIAARRKSPRSSPAPSFRVQCQFAKPLKRAITAATIAKA